MLAWRCRTYNVLGENLVTTVLMKTSLALAGPLLPHVSAASQHRGGRRAGVLVTQARRLPACPGARLQSPGVVYRPHRGSGGWRGQKVVSPRLNYASQAVMRLSGGDGWRTGIFVAMGFAADVLPAHLLQRKETCFTFAVLSRLDEYIFLVVLLAACTYSDTTAHLNKTFKYKLDFLHFMHCTCLVDL